MNTAITLIIIIFIVTLTTTVLMLRKRSNGKTPTKIGALFHQKTPLTIEEQKLYWKLKKALPDYEILSQVSFNAFIVTKGDNQKERHAKHNTARQKVADFLICDRGFNVIAVIELDDKSHNKEKDEKRDAMLKEAGIKTQRYRVKQLPTDEEINSLINNAPINDFNINIQ